MVDNNACINFRPWRGQNFKESGLLVLGWSHYEESEKYKAPESLGPNETIGKIAEHIEHGYDSEAYFWSKVRQAVNGGERETTVEERSRFWHSLAFYNYVQEPLQHVSMKPTSKMHIDARMPFLHVLSELQPRTIIVLGKTLWSQLPFDGHAGPNLITSDGESCPTWHYPISSKHFAIASPIDHPSVRGAWNAAKWQRAVAAALNQEPCKYGKRMCNDPFACTP